MVGFEERSYIRNSEGKYIYTNYERRKFFRSKSFQNNNNITTKKLPPEYVIKIVNGTRILQIKNKTYILGKASSSLGNTTLRKTSKNVTDIPQKSEGYNIMLNSCFVHRAYLEMYFDPLIVPSSLLEYVNEQQNCEDILMSIMVTKFLEDTGKPQCGVLAVKSSYIKNLDSEACELSIIKSCTQL